ncbi:hypothetical protein [Endozoicomonas ascidiicola]|uniref:hypothetical protein n=1 Tax=Endozoicomonas ascidiicola TaxID=1698521 RepID=UPI0012F9C48F|nr:hypothetical protein [Endozoicomonas ascidiicola]
MENEVKESLTKLQVYNDLSKLQKKLDNLLSHQPTDEIPINNTPSLAEIADKALTDKSPELNLTPANYPDASILNHMDNTYQLARNLSDRLEKFNSLPDPLDSVKNLLSNFTDSYVSDIKEFETNIEQLKLREVIAAASTEMKSIIENTGREAIIDSELPAELKLHHVFSNCQFNKDQIYLLNSLKKLKLTPRILQLQGQLVEPYIEESMNIESPINNLAKRDDQTKLEALKARREWLIENDFSERKLIKHILGRPQCLRQDLLTITDYMQSHSTAPIPHKTWEAIVKQATKFNKKTNSKANVIEISLLVANIKEKLNQLPLSEHPELECWPSKYKTYIQ